MATTRDTYVTAETALYASPGISGPAGVWTLDGEALVASDADGPATVLVPTEAVRLIAVDLPLAARAKRVAALPFAVEDLIAEPVDSVHLALGIELAPKRYLVGIVRHDRMAEWLTRVGGAGLDHAALVPDALALPVPGAGEWAVELAETRALVRAGDGTGFAVPAAVLRTAWEAAGRPRTIAYGAPLPPEMADGADTLPIDPLARRLIAPPLDLRQGVYAARRPALSAFGRQLARIAAIGVAAHVVIAAVDTIALRRIADARVADTRALVALKSPGTTLPQDDPASAIADLLPRPGSGGGANGFLSGSARIAAALAPLGPGVAARTMRLEGGMLIVDLETSDPAMADRVRTALREAGVAGTVSVADGGLRIASPAS